MNGGEDMATLKESCKQMDTYGNSDFYRPQQIGEKNILLLRELDMAMETLSLENRREIIYAAVELFSQQEK